MYVLVIQFTLRLLTASLLLYNLSICLSIAPLTFECCASGASIYRGGGGPR